MKLISVVDNNLNKAELKAEHGLCMYIEDEAVKILFDTGQSSLFLENAKILGIDISSIDHLVLSHGHFDHTGGLPFFADKNSKAKIYLGEDGCRKKYNKERSIGMPKVETSVKDRLVVPTTNIQLSKNITLIKSITIFDKDDTHFEGFKLDDLDSSIVDTFSEEQFLFINKDNKISIITGCSHRGIINIIKTAQQYCNAPVDLIYGGFHLKDVSSDYLNKVIAAINEIKPQRIAACHCTGIDAYSVFKQKLNADVFYNYVGTETFI